MEIKRIDLNKDYSTGNHVLKDGSNRKVWNYITTYRTLCNDAHAYKLDTGTYGLPLLKERCIVACSQSNGYRIYT